jgi:hypothetical protein
MGQYHTVYNLTKREFIHAHQIGNGLKLMEQVGWHGATANALFVMLANSNGRGGGDLHSEHPLIGYWAGDQILVQGDYAEPGDRSFVPEEELETFTNISAAVKELVDIIARDFGQTPPKAFGETPPLLPDLMLAPNGDAPKPSAPNYGGW